MRLLMIFYIVVLSAISLEVALQCGYRIGRYVMERKQNVFRKKDVNSTCTILALGESTTASGEDKSWPAQLESMLRADTDLAEKGIRCAVINEGVVGTNSTVIVSHIDTYIKTYQPTVIVSMMGINDYALTGGYGDPYSIQPVNTAGNTWKDRLHKLQLYRAYRLIRRTVEDLMTFHIRRNADALIAIGNAYREQGDYERSEKTLRRAVSVDPKNDWAWDNYGWLLRDEFRYDEAEDKYLMAIAVNHVSDGPYIEAANFYRHTGNFEESKRMYERALQVNGNSAWAYDELGNWYQDTQDYIRSEEQYRNAIEKDATFENAWFDLGTLLRDEGRLDEAESIYNHLLTFSKMPSRVAEEKETLERIRSGNTVSSSQVTPVVNDVTQKNYAVLHEKLTRVHIPLVAVQYPTKPVSLLLALFTGQNNVVPTAQQLEQQGIYVVDNESSFKEALRTNPYDAIFIDHFGGTFGHATPKGNELLASAIETQVKRILVGK